MPEPDPNPTKPNPTKSHTSQPTQLPFGATVNPANSANPDGSVHFRIFAPPADVIQIELNGSPQTLALTADGSGWHHLITSEAHTGSRYRYLLPDGSHVPDPASRYQPEDVHGPSEVIDPNAFVWRDDAWRGRPWTETILYELHVGAFTPEGTFQSAITKLDHLVNLGVTSIELMCLTDFAGLRNWGYDTVLLFAPDSAYGRPEDLKAFIDAAHARELSVILDVVYNHFGPEGNHLPRLFPEISSDRHETPWGCALNFDGKHSAVVREFIVQNALFWIREFHVDGLRLDASHTMVDDSPEHILDELRRRVYALNTGRPIHLILEDEYNIEWRLARDQDGKILGYAAQWNHDITHLLGSALSDLCAPERAEDETAKLGKALAEGFVIAAQMHGSAPLCSVPPTAFIAFVQTHDLVGNRIFGDRLSDIASRARIRAITSVLLLLPQIPMLFMGEEWSASSPFPFFSDYHGDLAEAVRKGRCDQLSKLDPAPSPEEMTRAPDPQAAQTFESAKLHWDELLDPPHADTLSWYQRLLEVRRSIIPLLSDLASTCGSAEIAGKGALSITWTLGGGAKLHLSANLCDNTFSGLPEDPGQEIWREGLISEDGAYSPWTVRWTIQTVRWTMENPTT